MRPFEACLFPCNYPVKSRKHVVLALALIIVKESAAKSSLMFIGCRGRAPVKMTTCFTTLMMSGNQTYPPLPQPRLSLAEGI